MFSPPPHNFILFELDSDIKFPLLRHLLFLSDLNFSCSQFFLNMVGERDIYIKLCLFSFSLSHSSNYNSLKLLMWHLIILFIINVFLQFLMEYVLFIVGYGRRRQI